MRGIKGKIKGIVAIMLIAVMVEGTVAGCSCTNNGTSQNTDGTTITAYKCDFKDSDIAIPKGTKFTSNGLEVTDKADATVKNVLDIGKQIPVITARDGEEESPELKYMKETNEKRWKWENYNAVAEFTAETANQIDPTLGKVGEFGKDVFSVVRGYYMGDAEAALSGVSGALNLFGIFKSGGVSNEQILMEVQKVYSAVQSVALDVKDLQGIAAAMSKELDETTMQAYRNGLQTFDNAMIAVDTDAEILQQMFVTGAMILQDQGVYAPDENASDQERQEYIKQLISTIKKNQDEDPDLNNFTNIMNDLINNYTLVAGELGKKKDFSPLTAYDSYWNMYFNWDSQAYALREAYRGNAEFQIKRAYAIIAVFYNIGSGRTGTTYQKYGQLLADALTGIEQNGPGISPQQVSASIKGVPTDGDSFKSHPVTYDVGLNNGEGLYSSTFQKHIKHFGDANGKDINQNIINVSNTTPQELVEKYASKLHGRSLSQDLKLAGLDINEYETNGIIYNLSKNGNYGKGNVIGWNGQYYPDAYILVPYEKFDDLMYQGFVQYGAYAGPPTYGIRMIVMDLQ